MEIAAVVVWWSSDFFFIGAVPHSGVGTDWALALGAGGGQVNGEEEERHVVSRRQM